MTSLWLPGVGEVDLKHRELAKAVHQYDERLKIGRDERTGEWALFVQMERGDDPFFVLALGPSLYEWTTERLLEEIYKRDTQRPHGAKLRDRINRHNAQLREARRKQTAEQTLEAAVRLEFLNRKLTGTADHIVVPDTAAAAAVAKSGEAA